MRFAMLVGLALWACLGTEAQWKEPPSTGSPQYRLPDRTNVAGQSGMGGELTAKLLNEQKNAKEHRVVIEVHTDGVKIVEPAPGTTQPKLDEGHIQYRVDDGPWQSTTNLRITVPNLTRGEHRIRVSLASNDDQPIGAETVLRVRVP